MNEIYGRSTGLPNQQGQRWLNTVSDPYRMVSPASEPLLTPMAIGPPNSWFGKRPQALGG